MFNRSRPLRIAVATIVFSSLTPVIVQASAKAESMPIAAAPAITSIRKPPSSPDLDPNSRACLSAPDATSAQGRVHNRFLWCQNNVSGGVLHYRNGVVAGRVMILSEAVAYGRDDGKRSVTVFFRTLPGTIVFDPPTNPDLRTGIMDIWADCVTWIDGCSAGGRTATKLFTDWNRDGSWHSWTVYSAQNSGQGPDSVSKHQWQFKGNVFSPEAPSGGVTPLAPHRIRCDSAVQGFSNARRAACIMDDVIPHLQYSLQSSKYSEVSEHIQCALDPGCPTYPGPRLKSIPGKYTGTRANPGLHRIMETFPIDPNTNRPFYANNTAAKNQACNALPTEVLERPRQQCDEFPFASTIEGAGKGDGNFSVKGVLAEHNSCAGNALGQYYRNDRILVWRPDLPEIAKDEYYVEITDVPGGSPDECLPLEDEPGEPNQPPTVNAGPDTTGDEGVPIALAGSASDPEGTFEVFWTYSLGPDTDAGMSCSFTDARGPNTLMTCTDDGTVTVTLTASDDINQVSDSAVVHVNNLAPALKLRIGSSANALTAADDELGITSPQPWQVFRVGDPVPFGVRFEDPGSNDTQTCDVDWDDGQVSTFVTLGRFCEGTHTFAHPGMYTIKPAITDDDGAVSEPTSVLAIVYDPEGGFVTEGGFIDSPAGALVAAPSAQGRLTIEFNPKYRPGEPGPTVGGGKVAASLHGAAFTLDSTALEWLVVAPSGKVAVKGVGTVNGQSGYGFVTYGFNAPDKVRLVVWPLSAGSYPQQTLVYDNREPADYDLDLSDPQPLAGGSLRIHD
ncbi:MAG TPA: PKD domain-containing protein [Candidatus Limnocylindrales bacterium]